MATYTNAQRKRALQYIFDKYRLGNMDGTEFNQVLNFLVNAAGASLDPDITNYRNEILAALTAARDASTAEATDLQTQITNL